MNGVKRKSTTSGTTTHIKRQKIADVESRRSTNNAANSSQKLNRPNGKKDDFSGFTERKANGVAALKTDKQQRAGPKEFKLETSSAEAHAKQRALAQERKASKPNADLIQRSKKIWEQLRRKSHVAPEKRKELVAELFGIITGRMQDFVFKHDSVRVIQCAHKYANLEQRRLIASELQGGIRQLAESRYGKFLVAKLAMDADAQVHGVITPEFFGHVKKLINHPEASWLVDDIYRQAAKPLQKSTMLKEWYGPEFALFHRKGDASNPDAVKHEESADLVKILESSPEKRRPILQHLLQMINGLIQKKMTGFTMLHDAMLQYFSVLAPGSEEQIEFLEILKGDIDAESEGGGGDLFRNLSFTRSGSRLVCLALAYGSAKDRKMMLRCFKDTIEMMAYDQHAKMVLVVGSDVPDDTKMTGKSVLHELLGQGTTDETQRLDRLEKLIMDKNARIPVLYPLAGAAKWLMNDADKAFLGEIHNIRTSTSKKDPETRRQELLTSMSAPLFELISKRADELVKGSFSCQFITEVLLEVQGAEKADTTIKVAQTAEGDPTAEGHVSRMPAAARMFKTLVTGGNFDPETKTVKLADPPLLFGAVLFDVIREHLVAWACSDASFVVVALLESENTPDTVNEQVRKVLQAGKKKVRAAAKGTAESSVAKIDKGDRSTKKSEGVKGNAGATMLLEMID